MKLWPNLIYPFKTKKKFNFIRKIALTNKLKIVIKNVWKWVQNTLLLTCYKNKAKKLIFRIMTTIGHYQPIFLITLPCPRDSVSGPFCLSSLKCFFSVTEPGLISENLKKIVLFLKFDRIKTKSVFSIVRFFLNI